MTTEVRVARTAEDLETYVDYVRTKSRFQMESIDLSLQDDWVVRDDCLSHRTGGFFSLCGYRDVDKDFESLVLFQPQGAFNGMAIAIRNGKIHLLLQARVEPGNSDLVQYGPTVQSTPANYLRLHGGKKTAYLEYFFEYRAGVKVLENTTQLDLGKRYYQKTKLLSYVQLPEMVECEENTIWVPLDVAAEVVGYDNFFNTDLRSMLGVFDWDSLIHEPSAAGRLGALPIPLKRQPRASGGLVPLTQLDKWKLSDQGIDPVGDAPTSARLYRVSCTNREVSEWVQPLFISEGAGHIVLYQRVKDGEKEYLLRRGQEFGVPGNDVFLPSEVVYPGEDSQVCPVEGDVLVDLVQSEEGGRFLENENRYQLIEIDGQTDADDECVWVDSRAFKTLLATSNLVSIQLRCIASLLLPELNPFVFEGD
jgi:oxidase EvaA